MGTRAETPTTTTRSALKIRGWVAPLALCIPLMMASPHPGKAYGVLTHHQLIDQAWNTVIVPILLSRFPSLTSEQLREAHAYAYGGCVVQDFGYYPFANEFFSDLTPEALSARIHSQRVRLRDRRIVALRGRQYRTCTGNQPIGRDHVP